MKRLSQHKTGVNKVKNIFIRKTSSSEFGDNEFLEIDGNQIKIKGGTKKQAVYAKSLVEESIKKDFLKIQKIIEVNKRRESEGLSIKNVEELELKLDEKINRLTSKTAIEILDNKHWL